MSSSTASLSGHHAQIDSNDPFSTPIRPSSRRTPSFSSSPSLSSNSSSLGSSSFRNDISPLFSPTTPLLSSSSGGRIPFSWEQLPGIPKKQLSDKKDSSLNLLPLPPAGTPTTKTTPSKKFNFHEISPVQKKYTSESFQRDPFYAALVKCSKDDQQDTMGNLWKGSKVTRTLSDRFGFVGMYASCKSNCPVSESIIYIPSSRPHGIFNGRSR